MYAMKHNLNEENIMRKKELINEVSDLLEINSRYKTEIFMKAEKIDNLNQEIFDLYGYYRLWDCEFLLKKEPSIETAAEMILFLIKKWNLKVKEKDGKHIVYKEKSNTDQKYDVCLEEK